MLKYFLVVGCVRVSTGKQEEGGAAASGVCILKYGVLVIRHRSVIRV